MVQRNCMLPDKVHEVLKKMCLDVRRQAGDYMKRQAPAQ